MVNRSNDKVAMDESVILYSVSRLPFWATSPLKDQTGNKKRRGYFKQL